MDVLPAYACLYICRRAVPEFASKAHKVVRGIDWRHWQFCTLQVDSLLDIDAVTGGDVKAEQLGMLCYAL